MKAAMIKLWNLLAYLWTGRTAKQRAYSAAILDACMENDRWERWYRKNVDAKAVFVHPLSDWECPSCDKDDNEHGV